MIKMCAWSTLSYVNETLKSYIYIIFHFEKYWGPDLNRPQCIFVYVNYSKLDIFKEALHDKYKEWL